MTPVSDVDKFLWRKIFDHNPLFAVACDKLAANEYAVSICPELKTAKVLWVGNEPDQIPAQVLAGNVMIKANCGSGMNVMVLGGKVDRVALRKKARLWLKRPYGQKWGEWGYKNVKRCLFVETLLLEDHQPIRHEYKFHAAGGRVAYVFVSRRMDDDGKHYCHFRRDGRIASAQNDGIPARSEITLPAAYERMVTIAERLAAPFDYMRCDLYELNGEIFFSELSPYPLSGQGSSNLLVRDLLNSAWDLRTSWFLTTPQSGWRKIYSSTLCRWLNEIGKQCST